jgi:DNA-binding beta-propeller fold protein YncE
MMKFLYFALHCIHVLQCVAKNASRQYLVSTFAGTSSGFSGDGGKATSAKLNAPYGVMVNVWNYLYIADPGNYRIRVVNNATNIISTFAGIGTSGNSGNTGLATNAQLNDPRGITVDSNGDIYIVDSVNNDVRKIVAKTNLISLFTTTSMLLLFFYYTARIVL